MSDTCIVCLGDLSTGIDAVAAQSTTTAKSPTVDGTNNVRDHARSQPAARETAKSEFDGSNEVIAHLQPCGHDLHNECLKPWVERANSCPICRANFHLVELMHHIGGEFTHAMVHVSELTVVQGMSYPHTSSRNADKSPKSIHPCTLK